MKDILHLGLDVGSTTVKLIIINKNNKILYTKYQRHFSDIRNTIINLIEESYENYKSNDIKIMVTGSGGISVANWINVTFIQEVIAGAEAVEKLIPETDVAIELGG